MKGYLRENEEYRIQRVHDTCFKDLTGKKFGKLTVLGVDHKRGKSYYWKCRCDCEEGNEVVVFGGALTSGHTKSCGCLHKLAGMIDLTGKRFGRLTVIEYSHKDGRYHYWKCRCDCDGKELLVKGDYLRKGTTKSCGCLKIERCKSKKPKESLIGRKFGDLEVISYNKHSYWRCRCICGNERVVHSIFLKNGSVTKCKECNDYFYGKTSKIEKDIVAIMRKFTKSEIIENCRDVLCGKEIDIYLPELKIGIEYCGSPFHASEGGIFGNKPKNYHQEKFLLAKERGIHLITIFDEDWNLYSDSIKVYLDNVINNNLLHNIPESQFVYTNNDFDDGEWVKNYGYVYDGQEDIPYFISRNKFKVYRSGISRWNKCQ